MRVFVLFFFSLYSEHFVHCRYADQCIYRQRERETRDWCGYAKPNAYECTKQAHSHILSQIHIYLNTSDFICHLVFVRCFFSLSLEILPRAPHKLERKRWIKHSNRNERRKFSGFCAYESVGVCSLIAEDVQKLISSFEQINFLEFRLIATINICEQ